MDISMEKKNPHIYTMKEEPLIGALVHNALDAFFIPEYCSLRAIPGTWECPEKEKDELLMFWNELQTWWREKG